METENYFDLMRTAVGAHSNMATIERRMLQTGRLDLGFEPKVTVFDLPEAEPALRVPDRLELEVRYQHRNLAAHNISSKFARVESWLDWTGQGLGSGMVRTECDQPLLGLEETAPIEPVDCQQDKGRPGCACFAKLRLSLNQHSIDEMQIHGQELARFDGCLLLSRCCYC